jgi:hypothetical protein
MARKNKIEKSAPNILSRVNIPLTKDLEHLDDSGISGGSTKTLVPERNTVALNM